MAPLGASSEDDDLLRPRAAFCFLALAAAALALRRQALISSGVPLGVVTAARGSKTPGAPAPLPDVLFPPPPPLLPLSSPSFLFESRSMANHRTEGENTGRGVSHYATHQADTPRPGLSQSGPRKRLVCKVPSGVHDFYWQKKHLDIEVRASG